MEALIEQGRYAEAKKLYMITEQNYRTDMDLPVGRQMTELYQKLPITDAAAASDPADIDVRLAACGIPTEYTYTAASGNG